MYLKSPRIPVLDHHLLCSICGDVNENTDDAKPVDEIQEAAEENDYGRARAFSGRGRKRAEYPEPIRTSTLGTSRVPWPAGRTVL